MMIWFFYASAFLVAAIMVGLGIFIYREVRHLEKSETVALLSQWATYGVFAVIIVYVIFRNYLP